MASWVQPVLRNAVAHPFLLKISKHYRKLVCSCVLTAITSASSKPLHVLPNVAEHPAGHAYGQYVVIY